MEIWKKKERGSITVFLALTILLILSLLASLLELGRFRLLTGEANLYSQSALKSALSAYQKDLWSVYGILGVTDEDALQVMNHVLNETQEASITIGTLAAISQIIQSQERLTDDGCRVLSEQVEKQMLLQIPLELWNQVKASSQENESYTDENAEKRILEEADWAQEENRRIQEEIIEEGGELPEVEPVEENPIEVMKEWKKKPLFELLLPAGTQVSELTMGSEFCVSGNGSSGSEFTVMESTALLLYSRTILSSFTSPKTGRGILYEQEYLVSGRSSDAENLKLALEKLLLVREMIRYAQKLKEPGTVSKAGSIATALVGASGLPPLVLAVQQGILLAWSFQDAIVDTKALLRGEQVELLTGKKLNYQEHLCLLMCLVGTQTGYERLVATMGAGIKIPLTMLSSGMTVEFQYEGTPLFEQFVLLPHNNIGRYKILSIREDSYFP